MLSLLELDWPGSMRHVPFTKLVIVLLYWKGEIECVIVIFALKIEAKLHTALQVGGKTLSLNTKSGGRVDVGAAWVNQLVQVFI